MDKLSQETLRSPMPHDHMPILSFQYMCESMLYRSAPSLSLPFSLGKLSDIPTMLVND